MRDPKIEKAGFMGHCAKFEVSTVHPRREIGDFAKPVATSGESLKWANQTPVIVNHSGSSPLTTLLSRLQASNSTGSFPLKNGRATCYHCTRRRQRSYPPRKEYGTFETSQ